MNRFFIENGKEGAKATFKKKQMYKLVSQSKLNNLIDFNYGEKRLYGRVDRYYQPIIPNDRYLQIVNLPTSTIEPIRVFNFVADAFADLQNKFKIKVARREISSDEKYLTDLVPTLAYQDPKQIFEKRTTSFSIAVGKVIDKNNLYFTNFTEFINVIMPYIKSFLKTNVLTFPAFVKSTDCPMSANGLVIEIAKINPNDDKTKYEEFYSSKNWEFFLNACNTYGFMVDCNMPNRIIADINSPNMIEKMTRHNQNINSADMFIANCYDSVSDSYLENFKHLLYRAYFDNKRRTMVSTVNTSYDSTRTIVRKVKSYNYAEFLAEIGEKVLLDLYLQIRFMEEESEFTVYEKSTLIRETIKLMEINGTTSALRMFEKILNKTFDYSGSLSYLERRQNELRK